MKQDQHPLEQQLGYHFKQPEYLSQALTHRSFGAHHNERLEFLGDSILSGVITESLFRRFPEEKEGDLSRLRSGLVRQETLFQIAQTLGLGQKIRFAEGELRSGGPQRPSILADALEALFGAVFLDGGFSQAQSVILRVYDPILSTLNPHTFCKDAKTMLQELLQGKRIALPEYTVHALFGEAHAQEFEVECLIPALKIRTLGRGISRRAAEQDAAHAAFEQIHKNT